MELKKTALHGVHEKLGAKMIGFAGYDMPVRYTSDIAEHKQVREYERGDAYTQRKLQTKRNVEI